MQPLYDNLQKLGFSQYEARAYVALLRSPRVTAYELSKRSAIPPSKIYEVVDKLVAKDLVATVDDSETPRYAALDPGEVTARFRHAYGQVLETVGRQLSHVAAADHRGVAQVWTLSGRSEIVAKAAQMVSLAACDVYLAVWPSELPPLLGELQSAEERGLDVAICLYGDVDPGVGTVYHHATDPVVLRDQGARRMVLSVDDAEALIAYFPELAEASAHWSRNVGFVQMAKDYIRHDIWMIKLLGRFSAAIDEAFGSDRSLLREVFGMDAKRALRADEAAPEPVGPVRGRTRAL